MSITLFFLLAIVPSCEGLFDSPLEGTFSINNDRETTYSRSIVLNNHIPKADEMRFSNSDGLWSPWEQYSASKNWFLDEGFGKQFVYAEFRSSLSGKVLQKFDSIVLIDAHGFTFSINNEALHTFSDSVNLNINAAGVSEMRISNNAGEWSGWEPYYSTKTWSLAPGFGNKSVFIQFRDLFGNITEMNDSINVVNTDSCSLLINNGSHHTFNRAVSLTLDVSGADKMRFSNNSGQWPGWEVYTPVKNWELSSGNGSKTIFAQFSDQAGNIISLNGSINFTDESTASFEINENALYSFSHDVILNINAPGAEQMRFSNDKISWSAWEPYSNTKSRVLSDGYGEKPVFAEIRDSGENTISLSDSITLVDLTACSLVIENGSPNTFSGSAAVSLSVTGAQQMRFSSDRAEWSEWVPFNSAASRSLGNEGTNIIYGQFRDASGNILELNNSIIRSSISLFSFLINSGSGTTFTASVSLDIDAPGAEQMRFSNDSSNWSSWKEYAPASAWTIEENAGEETVYIQIKDPVGNVVELSDQVTLLDPSGYSVAINNGVDYTFSPGVVLEINGSGYADMRLSNDSLNWSEWSTGAASVDWSLSSGEGSKTVYIQFRASNNSIISREDSISFVNSGSCSLAINNNAEYSFVNYVSLAVSTPGAAAVRFSNDGASWSEWENSVSVKEWELSAGPGVRSVFIEARDSAENILQLNKSITVVDLSTCSMVINNDAPSTFSDSVTLSMNITGAVQMSFSNDQANWSGWMPYSSSTAWALNPDPLTGTKTVYARFLDAAGKIIEKNDSITVIDMNAFSISINNGSENTFSQTVLLTMTVGSGEMRFSNNNADWSAWEPYSTSKSWNLDYSAGSKIVYVQFRDAGGNIIQKNDSIILCDTGSFSFSINNDASNTFSENVSLNITAPGAAEIRFSNEGRFWSEWEPMTSSGSWMLSSGSGEKTVYTSVKDSSGNEHIMNHSITLTGNASITFTHTGYNSGDPMLGLPPANIYDISAPGAVEVRRKSTSESTWPEWTPFTGSPPAAFSYNYCFTTEQYFYEFKDSNGSILFHYFTNGN
ncbi:MAG: hypothetical protein GY754_33295 [bacterium]|nr:hypothetical protein [bacterium]